MNHSATHIEPQAKTQNTRASFFSSAIQKKLSVGSANDAYELEADNIADKVMRMPEPIQNIPQTKSLIQKKCAKCEEEELQRKPLIEGVSNFIQRSSMSNDNEQQAPSHIESQLNSSKGSGSTMDTTTKSFMESRFGTDFSNVKIHTDSQAIQMSSELNAQAFTVGNDVYFNDGKYNPNSDSGKHLLAHELTHTVQQSGAIDRKIQKVCGRATTAVSGFPASYIKHINVDVGNPCSVTLNWEGPNAPAATTVHSGTIGNGGGLRSNGSLTNNCDDARTSNRAETNCTPKGDFKIQRQACHLGGHDIAKNASYFMESRGIAFHYWPSRPYCPASHGCVRMSMEDSALIYDNVISELTASNHNKPATTVHVGGTWNLLNCVSPPMGDFPQPSGETRMA